MTRHRLPLALVALTFAACQRPRVEPSPAGSATPPASVAPSATPRASRAPPGGDAPAATQASPGGLDLAMRDEEVGPLIARLSEDPGEFPSDNFVSNETSYLDVAAALRDPRLRGRAYVGVGPEQNLTYLALLAPRMAYVVDIRRGNLLEHLVLRGCFEVGETRAGFLRALLARDPVGLDAGAAAPEGFAALAAAFLDAPASRALRDEGVARTQALLLRLRVRPAGDDDAELERIQDAFFLRGLSLRYSMRNSAREYPTLGELLARRDPSGVESSFLASEAAYASVRRLVRENRVIPVVGDFGGTRALVAVAAELRARGLVLGVFYTSNVEQYLFEARTYPRFVAAVEAMPRDDASTLVRVWFDQGRRHPSQQPGQRTTQLAVPANAFLGRAQRHPFKSYWEVVTQAR